MSVITIFNQKGGVGKTTTAVNLSAALQQHGRKPYGIDLDPQAQFSAVAGLQADSGDASILALFQRNQPLRELLVANDTGLELIPGHVETSKVDTLFGKGYNVVNRLNTALRAEGFHEEARPVMIDCSPLIGVLSLNAIFACDGVIIPISADYLSAKAALKVEKALKALENVLKRRLPRRYLITRFDARRRMGGEVQRMLEEQFGLEVCRTKISENVSLAESPAHGKSIFQHAPKSRGAQDYDALAVELLEDGFIA